MKTEWDYTNLADAYLKRPDYAPAAISRIVEIARLSAESIVCDIGAGAAHLTIPLAQRGMKVFAVEPNDAMRKNGIRRTEKFNNVEWYEGVGEHTGLNADTFDLVTFGSSFNVTNRQEALAETQRILKQGGWFACLWNHRDLTDSIQKEIEKIIKAYVKDYSYGTRRENQTEVIRESGRFEDIRVFSEHVRHSVVLGDVIEGWRSHATLERQAGNKFGDIVADISNFLHSLGQETISIPYETRVWMACVKK